MSQRKIQNLVATVGTYKKDGVTKKRYMTCGAVLTDEEGRISVRLDALPTSSEWSGYFSVYDIEGRTERRESPPEQAPPPLPSAPEGPEDDIPF